MLNKNCPGNESLTIALTSETCANLKDFLEGAER